ncbi:MAG: hypothetical protein BAJATHORv1_20261 [Candidatus Thorarchaeota archaeon]|nr:MAG: hypothetical protein BAJATHORv1_20261 [Candidatus Thorarchaeota archaeon]
MILPELAKVAEGAFIKNVYQYSDIFVLKVYQPGGGTYQLLIEPGKRIHLTEYRRKAPRVPPKFCTVLRKYLRDRRILSVKQHELDRIVIIEVGEENDSHKLVAELFGRGNILLLDNEDTIFTALHYKKMRDRDIIPKATYEFPPQRGRDILDVDTQDLESIIMDSKANLVRTLASRLNLDSLSCEEICKLADLEPKTKASSLDEEAVINLRNGLEEFTEKLREGVSNPRIIIDEEEDEEDETEYLSFVPFEFETYEDLPFESYDTYSQAIDEYFGLAGAEEEQEEILDAAAKERKRLQRIIEKQQESIERLESQAEQLRKEGELIYSHFQVVQEILSTITKARSDGIPWDEIISRVEKGKEQGIESTKLIERIIPSQAKIVIRVNDSVIELDMRKSVQENASKAYEAAKKAERKTQGAKKQIEKTKAKLDEIDLSELEIETKVRAVKIRKKKWYEKFRWFKSSEGYLVLGGRDVKTNEQLAKRHMTANDVFLHASLHGAPYTIIKVPDKPPSEITLREAAQFAVTFSRAWQDGLTSGEAYWVDPEQVSFSPPTGEYLPTGAVMIYGNKNYITRLPVEISVGVIIEEEHAIPISGPPSAISSNTDYHIWVIPGTVKKGQLVKNIRNALIDQVPEESKHLITQIPQEDIMRVLPPGDGKIKKT